MSFDETLKTIQYNGCLNPFRAGRCLSTHLMRLKEVLGIGLNPFRAGRCLSTHNGIPIWKYYSLNPFRAGRCLSTEIAKELFGEDFKSQSLSSRAMSFDKRKDYGISSIFYVSIPFEQGDVFRQQSEFYLAPIYKCLNPFRAGRCLSTSNFCKIE